MKSGILNLCQMRLLTCTSSEKKFGDVIQYLQVCHDCGLNSSYIGQILVCKIFVEALPFLIRNVIFVKEKQYRVYIYAL